MVEDFIVFTEIKDSSYFGDLLGFQFTDLNKVSGLGAKRAELGGFWGG